MGQEKPAKRIFVLGVWGKDSTNKRLIHHEVATLSPACQFMEQQISAKFVVNLILR
jgi:hypothetical protein